MKFIIKGTTVRPEKDLPQYWDKMVLLCLSDRGHITLNLILVMCKHQIQINILKENCQSLNSKLIQELKTRENSRNSNQLQKHQQ